MASSLRRLIRFPARKRRVDTQPAAFVSRKRTSSFRVRCATTELNEIADEGGKSVRKDGLFHSSCSREESGTFLAIQIKVNLRSNKRKNHAGSKLFKPSSFESNERFCVDFVLEMRGNLVHRSPIFS